MCAEINSYLQDHYPETGTTITMAHYNPSKGELSVANVGDTRAYLVAGNGEQCIEAVPRFTMDQARPYIEGNGGCVTPDGRVARYGDPFSGGINVPDTLGDYGFPTLKTPRTASYTVNDKRGVFLVMGTDGFWGSDDCNFITEKDLKRAVRKFTRRFGRGPNLGGLKQRLVEITEKNKEGLAPKHRDNSTLLVAYIRP